MERSDLDAKLMTLSSERAAVIERERYNAFKQAEAREELAKITSVQRSLHKRSRDLIQSVGIDSYHTNAEVVSSKIIPLYLAGENSFGHTEIGVRVHQTRGRSDEEGNVAQDMLVYIAFGCPDPLIVETEIGRVEGLDQASLVRRPPTSSSEHLAELQADNASDIQAAFAAELTQLETIVLAQDTA